MRLRLIHSVLDAVTEDLSVRQVASGNNYRLEGLQSALAAVRQLRDTGVLQKEIQRVLSVTQVVAAGQDTLLFDSQTAHDFNSALGDLRGRAGLLKEVLSDFLGDEREDLVAFGLPADLNLGGIANTMKHLEKLLEQAFVNSTVGGEVRFLDFDRGSPWLEVGLGSTLAVNLLGMMMRLIHEHRARKQEHQAKQLMIQDLKISAEAREEMARALENELNSQMDEGLSGLLGKIKEDKDEEPEPEQRERFKFAIQELIALSERGLQVHPALLTPRETQLLFPDAAKTSLCC